MNLSIHYISLFIYLPLHLSTIYLSIHYLSISTLSIHYLSIIYPLSIMHPAQKDIFIHMHIARYYCSPSSVQRHTGGNPLTG